MGICSRSEGTLGLSLKKCTLSKVMLMTCWTPLPSWQPEAAGCEDVAAAAGPAPLVYAAPAPTRAIDARTLVRREVLRSTWS